MIFDSPDTLGFEFKVRSRVCNTLKCVLIFACLFQGLSTPGFVQFRVCLLFDLSTVCFFDL